MTVSTQQMPLPTIDQAVLTDLVRAALRNDGAEIDAWQSHEMHGGGAGSHIYKVRGEAHVYRTPLPWSLVLKVFDLQGEGLKAASVDPAAWDYWKREWLAYQAPWLQEMQGSLVAPRCLGAADHPGVVAWLAMEDLSHVDERPWPHTRFQTVARHVGAFNGAYLVGRPMPRDSWLSHGWLRGWTERAEPMVALLPTVADHAVVREIFAETTITELLRLWEERNAFFDALDALPQTLCHQGISSRATSSCARRRTAIKL